MGDRPWLVIVVFSLASAVPGAHGEANHMTDQHTQKAAALMDGFAGRTGITSEYPRKRYLWTDAFAVCNFLGLARLTGEKRYEAQALQLVEQVHHTLGRHRDDDPRTGWISGLRDREGEAHPTRGGLRIGKELPERAPSAPFDEQLEWERDGQYFHYLTQWMHALDQMTRATGQAQYNYWGRDLANSAYKAFTYLPSARSTRKMFWKMSIDLSRPLVPSMGQHDPLDGYVTAIQLQATATRLPDAPSEPGLEQAVSEFAVMVKNRELGTTDPLGLGGLLTDAYRVKQLMRQGVQIDPVLLEALLTAALGGLEYYVHSGELQQPAGYRLAFRELGLAIGLHAVERMWEKSERSQGNTFLSAEVRTRLKALMKYVPIGKDIESFWLDPEHQRNHTWREHPDINEVMLATSLVPDGYLVLLSPDYSQR